MRKVTCAETLTIPMIEPDLNRDDAAAALAGPHGVAVAANGSSEAATRTSPDQKAGNPAVRRKYEIKLFSILLAADREMDNFKK